MNNVPAPSVFFPTSPPAPRPNQPVLLYLSGPLTTGDTIANVRDALRLGAKLIDAGYVVIIPHEKALAMEMLNPKSYDEWLAYDFKCILRCDAVLRMPGASRGGDAEVAFALRNRIPVYWTLERLFTELPPPDRIGTLEVVV